MVMQDFKNIVTLFNRGGVLEPEGTVEIKFKMKDLVKSMSRLDPAIHNWNKALVEPDLPAEEQAEIRKKIKQRQDILLPIYHQVKLVLLILFVTDKYICTFLYFYICRKTPTEFTR